jgi:glutamate synthase domain-containing protein 1
MARPDQAELNRLREEAAAHGLYSPMHERDACGMGFVAHMKGEKSHSIVRDAMTILAHLSHRGACGCDPETSDGSGILLQIPHEFYKERCASEGIQLPDSGLYAVGMLFLPRDPAAQTKLSKIIKAVLKEYGAPLLGQRKLHVKEDAVGFLGRDSMPEFAQIYVGVPGDVDQEHFERILYTMRRRIENEATEQGLGPSAGFYVCSFSSKTVVYKGLLIPERFSEFYEDLKDPSTKSAIALVHSRFSTNTFPSWPRAHPYRFIVHNGEDRKSVV